MFTVSMIGEEQLLARLDRMPERIHGELVRETHSLAISLQGYIISQKLHGQVLNQRSGKLARSIQEVETETETSVQARVFSSGDVKYAAIHEYGFTGAENVKAHIRSMVFGKTVAPFMVPAFTRQMNMPERSFMRSSLSEFQGRISKGYAAAIKRGATEG